MQHRAHWAHSGGTLSTHKRILRVRDHSEIRDQISLRDHSEIRDPSENTEENTGENTHFTCGAYPPCRQLALALFGNMIY